MLIPEPVAVQSYRNVIGIPRKALPDCASTARTKYSCADSWTAERITKRTALDGHFSVYGIY